MENLSQQFKRQFTMPPPPCEAEYRQARESVPPVKRMLFPFHARRIGFIGIASYGLTERMVSTHIQHGACMVTIPKEESNTPALDRAKFQIPNAELIVNSAYPLATIEDDSKKETYHRKNIIEKRRSRK